MLLKEKKHYQKGFVDMTKAELINLMKDLSDDGEILIESPDGSAVDFCIEPITISCSDPTVIGMVLIEREEVTN